MLGDRFRYWRFKNMVNIVIQAKGFLESKGIDPRRVLPETLVPLLDASSLQEDNDLQTKWAAMLAVAADPTREEVPPSYPRLLAELSAIEVKLIDWAYDQRMTEFTQPAAEPDDELRGYRVEAEVFLNRFNLTWPTYQRIISNLNRLGICDNQTSITLEGTFQHRGPTTLKVGDPLRVIAEESPVIFAPINLTRFGVLFVEACRFGATESEESTTVQIVGHTVFEPD